VRDEPLHPSVRRTHRLDAGRAKRLPLADHDPSRAFAASRAESRGDPLGASDRGAGWGLHGYHSALGSG